LGANFKVPLPTLLIISRFYLYKSQDRRFEGIQSFHLAFVGVKCKLLLNNSLSDKYLLPLGKRMDELFF